MENSKTVKLVLKTLYDLAIPLLGIYPDKTLNLKGYVPTNVHSSTIHNSQDMEAT